MKLYRVEQLVGPAQQVGPRVGKQIRGAGRIARFEATMTMLADDLTPEILHAHLKAATAGRALLNKVRGPRHDGISFTSPASKRTLIVRYRARRINQSWLARTLVVAVRERNHNHLLRRNPGRWLVK